MQILTRIRMGLLLAVFLTPMSGWCAVDLIVPGDNLLTNTDTLVITGRAARGQRLQWSAQRAGEKETGVVTADWGNLFEIFLLLEPGLNRVQIEEVTLDVFYDPGGMEAPERFEPQRIHAGDVARCGDCHDPQHSKLLNGGYPRVCFTCHIVVSANPDNLSPAEKDEHFRTAVAECGRCHAAHTATDPMLLKGSRAELCGSCHTERLTSPSRHQGVEENQCSACHDPHYSGYPASLLQPQPDLCQRCHRKGLGEGTRHPPVPRRDACTACHAPHGSAPDLLRAEATELCSSCHDWILEKGHGEELAGCPDCHDSHGFLESGMVRTGASQRCNECHEGIDDGLVRHPALDQGCEACHRPHDDGDRQQARRSCTTCHDLTGDQQLGSLHGNLRLGPQTCVGCHVPHASDLPHLARGRLHAPLAEGNCAACHGGGADRSVIVADAATRCRMCHPLERELASQEAVLHQPVSEGRCHECHDPHMAKHRGLLRAAEAPLCRSCHPVAQAGEGKELHPPAESCTECHSPHGGPNALLLSHPPDQSCRECHEDPRETTDPVHPALDEGCTGCHDPHAGFLPGYLRGGSPTAACRECHEVPDLTDGRRLHSAAGACSECHDPHGSARRAYLTVDPTDPCTGCHEVPGAANGAIHDALGDGCGTCHDPHSGYGGATLRSPERELCLTCHEDPLEGVAHPHTPAGGGCSPCHQPHSAAQAALLRAPWEQLCAGCHDFGTASAERTLHEPVEDCGTCHTMGPHGTQQVLGLQITPPALCLECHEDPREAPGSVHPALEDGCLVCHTPHAGRRPGLQKGASAGEACLDCHEDPTGGLPVVHAPVEKGCSSCHQPHSSTRRALLREEGNALCRVCHDTGRHRHTLDPVRGEKYSKAKPFPLAGNEYACTGCHRPHAADQEILYPAPTSRLCEHCHPL